MRWQLVSHVDDKPVATSTFDLHEDCREQWWSAWRANRLTTDTSALTLSRIPEEYIPSVSLAVLLDAADAEEVWTRSALMLFRQEHPVIAVTIERIANGGWHLKYCGSVGKRDVLEKQLLAGIHHEPPSAHISNQRSEVMQRQRSTSTATSAFQVRPPSTIVASGEELPNRQDSDISNATWASSAITRSSATTLERNSPQPNRTQSEILSGPHVSVSGTFDARNQDIPNEEALFKKMRSLRKKIRFAHQHLGRPEAVRSAAENEKIEKLPLFEKQLRECEQEAHRLGLLPQDVVGLVSEDSGTTEPVPELQQETVAPKEEVRLKMVRSIARHRERMRVIEGSLEIPEDADSSRRGRELLRLQRQQQIRQQLDQQLVQQQLVAQVQGSRSGSSSS